MPSRPMKRSRSRSGDGHVDRPLKRVSLAPVNSTDVVPFKPVFHTPLPVMDFSQQKSSISSTDGYSMTPSWRLRPQSDTISQAPPSDENRVDDGDVRMDCETSPKRLASPITPPSPSSDKTHNSSIPADAEQLPLRTTKPLTNCPSLEMSEIPPPVPQGPTPRVVRSSQPKLQRFTMGP